MAPLVSPCELQDQLPTFCEFFGMNRHLLGDDEIATCYETQPGIDVLQSCKRIPRATFAKHSSPLLG